MSTQQRMKDRIPGTKPRVCKLTNNGMWWAEVQDLDGKFRADCFFNHHDAMQQANEYAAMNQAALALRNLEVTA